MKIGRQIFHLITAILLLVNLTNCRTVQNAQGPSAPTAMPGNEKVLAEPENSQPCSAEPETKATTAHPDDKAALFEKMLAFESNRAMSAPEKSNRWFAYIRQYYFADTETIARNDYLPTTQGENSFQSNVDHQAAIDGLQSPAPAAAEILGNLDSMSRGKITHYYAFMPLSPEPMAKFPILYLLHGAYDDYSSWPTHCREQLKNMAVQYGMIIICPDGEPFGWYADSRSDPDSKIESYFINELIPEIDHLFPVQPEKRAIAGLSMGGHGALVLALRHPRIFSSVSSMSGILDITRHKKQWHLSEVFGPYEENKKEWSEHSAYRLCSVNNGALISFPLMVTVGLKDTLALAENRAFNELLTKLSINYFYQESEGNHDWKYWASQLRRHVEFHAGNMNAQIDRLVPAYLKQ